ncbi:MAG: putative 2OG-Fe(II) oxygenase [Pseudomonadota bacterium]
MNTEPALGPERWIQPKAGRLVLFPSFVWHGTEPIRDGSVRVTAPFDVVPV